MCFLGDIPRTWFSPRTRTRLRLVFVVSISAFFLASAPSRAAEQGGASVSVAAINFDIPSQPLGTALVAFGAAAKFDFYYNAALAEGRRSATVVGKLTPALALQKMLQGTGLVPRMSAPDAAILIPAVGDVVVPRRSVVGSSVRYESYFAAIQARISDALCRGVPANQEGHETFLRVWLAGSGVIEQVEVMHAGADRTKNRNLADAVQGLAVGPPPQDMPQPVTLVVFPPSVARHDCRSVGALPRAN